MSYLEDFKTKIGQIVFQNQLKKRIVYYKKQNYTVNIYDNNSLTVYKNLNYIPKKPTKPVCLI